MNKKALQQEICAQLCADVTLVERSNGMLMVSVPFSYPDGDKYSVYVKELGDGRIRISDEANTMMRMSYDTPDVEKYFKGNRGKLMEQILREHHVQEDDGNFYVDTPIAEFSQNLFKFGQALNQIYDLSYLDRERGALGTFYADLEQMLRDIISGKPIVMHKEYVAPNLENAENYVIDFSLQNGDTNPLFLFGVPTADKAKLVTITVQHLLLHDYAMRSLIVFENQEELPKRHLSRLMDANVGGSQVSSIASREPIEKNINRALLAHAHEPCT